jgi:hypothetical protein
MFDPNPTEPFFLIVADFDTGLFSVEGPMTDDGPWNLAAGRAREKHRRVVCGPASTIPSPTNSSRRTTGAAFRPAA